MSLLAYCITKTSASARCSGPGVDGMQVTHVDHGELRCFVSESVNTGPVSGAAVRDAAIAFHRVLDEVFQQSAIIPFRLPTILTVDSGVIAHLTEHSAEYLAALTRLRDLVQMEIRIQFKDSAPGRRLAISSASADVPATRSGTEYLREMQVRHAKLDRTAIEFQHACATISKRWLQRDSVDGVRCFALIGRDAVRKFQLESETVAIQPQVVARITGPWPATGFLKEE